MSNERNASLLAGYTASAAYLIKIKFKQLLIFTLFYKFPAAIAPFRYFSITAVIYSNFASCKNFEIYPN